MPHFGLMDPHTLGPEAAALQRARLHIRAGKRRVSQGKVSAGIVTLYDALIFAMEWYLASEERRKGLKIRKDDDMGDERTMYRVLRRSDVIGSSFDYEAFNSLVEKALRQEMPDYDCEEMLAGLESVMGQLGVMPFDEKELPPEDSSTF